GDEPVLGLSALGRGALRGRGGHLLAPGAAGGGRKRLPPDPPHRGGQPRDERAGAAGLWRPLPADQPPHREPRHPPRIPALQRRLHPLLRRLGGAGRRAAAVPRPYRDGASHPGGGPEPHGGPADGHPGGAGIGDYVRPGHRLRRDRGGAPPPDLLDQPHGGRPLHPQVLRHRGAGRHGERPGRGGGRTAPGGRRAVLRVRLGGSVRRGRELRDLPPGASLPAAGSLWREGMTPLVRRWWPTALFFIGIASMPLWIHDGYVLQLIFRVLVFAVLGMAWNFV